MKRCTPYLIVSLMLIAGLIIAGAAPPSQPAAKVFKIGAIEPLSGFAIAWGIPVNRGQQMAIDEINARGGFEVAGQKYKIERVSHDSKWNVAEAVTGAHRLVYQEGVKYLVNLGGALTQATQPITEPEKVITFYFGAGGEEITNPKNFYTFRTISSGRKWMYLFTGDIVKEFSIKRYAIIGADSSVGREDAKWLREYAGKAGATITSEEFVDLSLKEFYPILTTVLAKKPDIIELASTPSGVTALIVKQARELGYTGKFSSSAYQDPATLLSLAGAAYAEGVFFNCWVEPPTAKYAEVEQQYYQRYGKGQPWTGFPPAYSQINYMIAAIQKADTFDTTVVAETLAKMEFDSLEGKARFGGKAWYGIDRDILFTMACSTIKAGRGVTWRAKQPPKEL